MKADEVYRDVLEIFCEAAHLNRYDNIPRTKDEFKWDGFHIIRRVSDRQRRRKFSYLVPDVSPMKEPKKPVMYTVNHGHRRRRYSNSEWVRQWRESHPEAAKKIPHRSTR